MEPREQKLSTPSLPVLPKRDSQAFWQSLKKEYDNLLGEKYPLPKRENRIAGSLLTKATF